MASRNNYKGFTLDSPVTDVPYVGPGFAEKLANLGIETVGDLLWHVPARYLDTREVTPISEVQDDGESYVITGELIKAKPAYLRGHRFLFDGEVTDKTGSVKVVWFNQRYLATALHIGDQLILYGKAKEYKGRLVMQSPEFEIIDPALGSKHLGVVAPIYPLTEGISQRWLRSRIQFVARLLGKALKVRDSLPKELITVEKLQSKSDALREIHLPLSNEALDSARETLAFEELFRIISLISKQQANRKRQPSPKIKINKDVFSDLTSHLPYRLTASQQYAIQDIYSDYTRSYPADRLLNGDVGSGKTIVAVAAAVQALSSGYNVLFMAPTAILATQHFNTIKELLSHTEFNIELVISKSTQKAVSTNRAGKTPTLFVGTHAILHRREINQNIGLVIVDEQHRFGVAQRDQLIKESAKPVATVPHRLTLTATPIPRTLALVFFGNQEISYLNTVPTGRKKIKSQHIKENKREHLYEFIRRKLKISGSRVFVVCPLIEESEKLQAKAVETEYTALKKQFPKTTIELLHGKLKHEQKDQILSNFKSGKTRILVTTPVIEVGIDIPEADIMVIEGAERFGLAQLHQLRGRVGRGEKQSYCFTLTTTNTKNTIDRITYFCETDNGLKLSEFDLKNRGPGEIYGYRQAGLPDLKVARLDDLEFLKRVKNAVEKHQNKTI